MLYTTSMTVWAGQYQLSMCVVLILFAMSSRNLNKAKLMQEKRQFRAKNTNKAYENRQHLFMVSLSHILNKEHFDIDLCEAQGVCLKCSKLTQQIATAAACVTP